MSAGKSIPFFQRAAFRVQHIHKVVAKQRQPQTDIDDLALFCAIKLAKLGYYSGDPSIVMESPVDMVLAILSYETFDCELNMAYNQIMKEAAP